MQLGQFMEDAPRGPERSFAKRWDPRPGAAPVDLGWIGEDSDGVWTTLHPDAALLDHPELWGVVAEFNAGMQEMTAEDQRTKSAFEFQAKLTMVAALGRKLAPKEVATP